MNLVFIDEMPEGKKPVGFETIRPIMPRLEPPRKLNPEQLRAALQAAAIQIPIYARAKKTVETLLPGVFSHNETVQAGRKFFAVVMTKGFKFYYDQDSGRIALSHDHAGRARPQRRQILQQQEGKPRIAAVQD